MESTQLTPEIRPEIANQSLNEQLATKVMDMCQPPEPDGYWWKDVGNDCLERFTPVKLWNPTTDLNQLRMCYKALSKIEKLRLALLLDDNPVIVFTDPELIAQDILKAKVPQ